MKLKTYWERNGRLILTIALIVLGIFTVYSTLHKPKPLATEVRKTTEYLEQKIRADSFQAAFKRGQDTIKTLLSNQIKMEYREALIATENQNLQNRLYEVLNDRNKPLPVYSSSEVSTWYESKFGNGNP